jgi:hypothetical protein
MYGLGVEPNADLGAQEPRYLGISLDASRIFIKRDPRRFNVFFQPARPDAWEEDARVNSLSRAANQCSAILVQERSAHKDESLDLLRGVL